MQSSAVIILAISIGLSTISRAQVPPSIGGFVPADKVSAYFNCAYKRKIASKKCLVTKSYVSSAIDARTRACHQLSQTMQETR